MHVTLISGGTTPSLFHGRTVSGSAPLGHSAVQIFTTRPSWTNTNGLLLPQTFLRLSVRVTRGEYLPDVRRESIMCLLVNNVKKIKCSRFSASWSSQNIPFSRRGHCQESKALQACTKGHWVRGAANSLAEAETSPNARSRSGSLYIKFLAWTATSKATAAATARGLTAPRVSCAR
jgi:hypothetical protein